MESSRIPDSNETFHHRFSRIIPPEGRKQLVSSSSSRLRHFEQLTLIRSCARNIERNYGQFTIAFSLGFFSLASLAVGGTRGEPRYENNNTRYRSPSALEKKWPFHLRETETLRTKTS